MFDSEKIARQALHRAEELKTEKKRRNTILKTTSLLGTCAACVIITLLVFPFGSPSNSGIFIGDDQIPLAPFSLQETDKNAKPYTGIEQIIRIPTIDKTIFKASNDELALLLLNPAENTCDFIFEIVLTETEETIFKSELVEPRMCIENPLLSRTLEEGEYSAVLRISFISENSLSGGVDINFRLLAE